MTRVQLSPTRVIGVYTAVYPLYTSYPSHLTGLYGLYGLYTPLSIHNRLRSVGRLSGWRTCRRLQSVGVVACRSVKTGRHW